MKGGPGQVGGDCLRKLGTYTSFTETQEIGLSAVDGIRPVQDDSDNGENPWSEKRPLGPNGRKGGNVGDGSRVRRSRVGTAGVGGE